MTSTSRISANLKDKVAIVTGASRGLGKEFSRTLGSAGCKLACVDINEESLNKTVSEFRDMGYDAAGFICNVTNGEQVNQAVEDVCKKFGTVHILVNNAGITKDGMFMRMQEDQWDAVININLKGTFLFAKAVAKPMIKNRWGRIINIASIAGLVGNAGQANYSASKAGVIGFTRTVSKELAGRSITVNAVAPGFIETDMTAILPTEYLEEAKKNRIPLGKLGNVQDVADAVLFLASESAEYITGQVITVDGGLTI